MSYEPQTSPNQFALLAQRRFAPFFWTQFLGAGNDNLFKFAFTLLVTYRLQVPWLRPEQAGLMIGGLFILPFLLFSATSGQLADKYDKAWLMRFVKALELAIMLLAAWGFWAGQVMVLLGCTFLMGLHSTLFGPVKYAYLPQHLNERELTGGNGMIEMGTFVAILLGNVAGGLLINHPQAGPAGTALACVVLALAGLAAVQWVPASPAIDPGLTTRWNPLTETWANLKLAHGQLAVFRSLLAISWMWAVGAVFLSQFPAFAKNVLGGGPDVALVLLIAFSAGVGIGSLLCEVLSRRHVEIGLVPLGAIGMTVFAVDLFLACRGVPLRRELDVAQFLAVPAHWRVLSDLFLLALSAGLFSVPMYARAFEQARRVLEEGELLGIFPEDAITRDGLLQEFKGGIMKVLEGQPVPVVPVGLQNLWGSFFSRIDGRAMSRPFRRGLFSRVGVVVGAPIPAAQMSPDGLRERVRAILQG